MCRHVSILIKRPRIGRWCLSLGTLICLAVSGCAGVDLRGEPFYPDPSFDVGRESRPVAFQGGFFGASNKARQIESHLGIQ